MAATTNLTDKILNHIFRTTAFTQPNIHLGLILSATDREAGTHVEASYTGYARILVDASANDLDSDAAWVAPAAGEGGRFIENVAILRWAQNTGAAQTAVAIGVYDALTVGNLLLIIELGGIGFLADGANTGDVFTVRGHGMANDTKVVLKNIPGGTFPAGPSENTVYFIIGQTANTFQVSLTASPGSAVLLTGDGQCLVKPQTEISIATNATPEVAANALDIVLD